MFDATPFLRLYARRRASQLAQLDSVACQQHQLKLLLQKAAHTAFGKDHDFSRLLSVDDYQAAVPLRTYEGFWADYWKAGFPILEDCTWPGRMTCFSLTSGTTTGKTKYIPYTKELKQSNAKAGLDLLTYHLLNRPASRILDGKCFVLGGSTGLQKLAPGVVAGDLSGIATTDLPLWIKPWHFPHLKMAHIKDLDEKTSVLARASVHQNLRLIAGIPSWLRIFFQKLKKQACGQNPRLAEVYPGLEMVVHGGVNFAPYRRQFEAYLEGSHAELREVYPASEGFLAAADRSSGQGLRLMLQHGIFFEFVPLDELDSTWPTRHWIANLEKDLNYAVVLTTCAGLWSYVIGDTVRFVNLSPPRVLITGRTSYMLSAFGEHLIGEEIENAVSEAAASCGCLVADFSVGARYPDEGNERGGHLYIMEFLQNGLSQDVIRKMAEVIDRRLIERNADYAAHRSEGLGMDAPQTIVAGRGCFAAWMKSRGKLGGQNKVPRIINDPDLFASLISFVDQFNKLEPS